jgi:hypothetical protein
MEDLTWKLTLLVAGVTWKTGACARAGDGSSTADMNMVVRESPIDFMVRPMLSLPFHTVNTIADVVSDPTLNLSGW